MRILPTFLSVLVLIGAVTTTAGTGRHLPVKAYATPPVPVEEVPLSLDEARRSIAILDRTYQSALRHIHRRFPVSNGQPVVAAAVVRDIQREVRGSNVPSSRFLAVGAKAMNPDHEPRDAFERQAVQELKRGSRWVESVESGRLRVASTVPLGGGCFPCHSTASGGVVVAAISWSVPVRPAVASSSPR